MDGLGCDYWAITDHSKSSFVANGLDPDACANARSRRSSQPDTCGPGNDFRLLTGSEVDILADGSSTSKDLLAELDVVVASFHQASVKQAEMTNG